MHARAAALAILLAAGLTLSACGGGGGRLGLGIGSDDKKETAEASASAAPVPVKPATPQERAVQVGWTAASARHCLFGLDPDKLKRDYLAYEKEQGATPQQMAKLEQAYDKAWRTFFETVKQKPDYCSKARIEQIRPDINRHLAGDYAPGSRKSTEPEKKELWDASGKPTERP